MYTHVRHLSFAFQAMVESYYTDFTYDDLVEELQMAKEVGDEFTILLASKWLRRNITVITSKKDWKVYSNVADDIVITYKGKDRYNRGKWSSSQLVSKGSQGGKNKTAREFEPFSPLSYVTACGNSHSAE